MYFLQLKKYAAVAMGIQLDDYWSYWHRYQDLTMVGEEEKIPFADTSASHNNLFMKKKSPDGNDIDEEKKGPAAPVCPFTSHFYVAPFLFQFSFTQTQM